MFLTSVLSGAEERTWTRTADGNTVRATMLSQDTDEGTVTLKIGDKSYTLPIDSLSEADQNYLDDQLAAEEERLKALEGLRGTQQEHLCEDAEVKTWHSYLPIGYDPEGEPQPVCFVFSGSGKSVSVLTRLKPAADELNWILIGIDAYSNRRVRQGNQIPAMVSDCKAIQKEVFEQFHVDRKKIVYGGMSGGAWWAFRSSHELGEDTAGIVSFGGWMSNEYSMPYPRKMAVAIVNGDRDEGANRYVEPDTKSLERDHRAVVKTFTFSGGHTIAPAEVAADAARWVHETKEF